MTLEASLAPWGFEFPFQGSLTSTFLVLSLILLFADAEGEEVELPSDGEAEAFVDVWRGYTLHPRHPRSDA